MRTGHEHFEQSSIDCSTGDYKPSRKSELLLNIERYNEIHSSHHVVNKRLIGRRGLFPYGIRTNICERKNLDPVYKAKAVQNIENIISTVKSKSPETRVKFDAPNVASTPTSRRWLIRNTVINPSNRDSRNLPEKITSNVLKNQIQALKSTLLTDQEPQKCYGTVAKKYPEFDEMCNMYVEFVDSICEDVISAHDKISPKDDYTVELYKRLRETIVNSRRSSPRKQPRPVTTEVNDKTTNYNSNFFSAPSSVNEDFVFKPVLISSKAPGK
ncbi:uncharacterized protein LOC126834975 [Adelges cooleyi]|uniref:uncharacterized protein LOC126834975 n=1 Tax=Adelges cooleyi TaxID=133065 RepID=UPI00217F8F99|nr:uncharacterized protein LOC126834975 [Adelges cooleyi]